MPAVDDPAISAFAAELQKLRLQVTLARSPSWAKGIKLRKKYAEISPALEEVIAGLREETAEALDQCSTANIDPMTWTGVNTVLAADEHRVTISKLEEFDAIRRWIDNNAFLQHPALLGAVDFWEAYAEHLAAIFTATVTRTGTNPPPVANPLYRFVKEVVPSVTGEKPSFQAVRSHFMRKRLQRPMMKFDPWPRNLPQDFECSQTGIGVIAAISLIPAPHWTWPVHEPIDVIG